MRQCGHEDGGGGAVITALCDLLNLYKRTLPEIMISISSTNYVDRDRVPSAYVRVTGYNLAIRGEGSSGI